VGPWGHSWGQTKPRGQVRARFRCRGSARKAGFGRCRIDARHRASPDRRKVAGSESGANRRIGCTRLRAPAYESCRGRRRCPARSRASIASSGVLRPSFAAPVSFSMKLAEGVGFRTHERLATPTVFETMARC